MVLLFVDMLGVKARWRDGRDEVQKAFARFHEFVTAGLASSDVPPALGGLDSDAAAFVYDDVTTALRVGQAIYLRAFCHEHDGNRYWLRGVVVPFEGEGLRVSTPLEPPFEHLAQTSHSDSLLDAIAVEQSGRIKGMRLLVTDALITPTVRTALKIPIGNTILHPCRHLNHSGYPDPIAGVDWQDFLWMATDEEPVWAERVKSIRDKMRWSSDSVEETTHAAATRVVFDQCRAIMGDLGVDWA